MVVLSELNNFITENHKEEMSNVEFTVKQKKL